MRRFFGVDISVLRRDEAIEFCLHRLAWRKSTAIAFANANLLMHCRRDPTLSEQLRDMLVLNDGVGADLASWVLHGSAFPENLNGTDFLPALLTRLPEGTKVFLYGAEPQVAERAADILADRFPVEVCGWRHGYIADDGRVAAAIDKVGADVVLVALGNPRQERWVSENFADLAAPLVISVGAFLDFQSGRVSRAPGWMRRIRFEWVYRLLMEPNRLRRRYTVDVVQFLFAVGVERLHRKPSEVSYAK
jgi:exopolysaccharide biosynthesis WecB/TagA/CpsF family protein